ncbi:MAG: tRNA uridine-5-carboxymethylaminomethyl(34) synthesis GTPase MnmE [Treponema sp.]|jgi:tRNA modification GTPase|nr:tRNA uridine-5-carboxymethylaminomethyl(34) synthesis GTPase MnmE [Treponema sp.]
MNPLFYTYGDDAPIAAPATPLAECALAIIRISGKDAIPLVASVFSRPRKLLEAPGNTVVYGWILDENEKIDEVLVSVYRGPRSYTGEDGADISCHGGIATVRGVMRVLHRAGFRDSLPGEFTFRAFMQGKLDLTRAESVMELVSAKTDQARSHAVNRLAGSLEQEVRGIKDQLVQVLAGTEIFLDYSEDEFRGNPGTLDDEAAGRLPDRALAEEVLARLRVLAGSYRMERLYHEGALVVIAGRPNAGKSSLFNRLLKEERSIVTDIPGTTRDWIEGWISIEGIPIRLVDTAGIREDAVGGMLEKLGMERSRALLRDADLVLYMVDATCSADTRDEESVRFFSALLWEDPKRILPVKNKLDLCPPGTMTEEESFFFQYAPFQGISAKTGWGIAELAVAIAGRLTRERGGAEARRSSSGIGTERQKGLIHGAIQSLEDALTLADQGEPLDLIAPLLREGVQALGTITGEVSTADMLEVMFSRFCVGK